uniref:type II secretion system protein n=1 Tax=Candidatus Stercorousia sp. TaxID=3048886 RepID=UPI004026606C
MHHKIEEKNAFTLAEVLITLGIIGVVAAMTMPTLINNTKKQELVAKYKKVYAEISQAYLMAQNNNGGTIEGLCTSANDYITLFSKYLKNVQTCETSDKNPYCFTRSFKTLDGRVINSDPGATLTTTDGATLLFLHISSSCKGTTELNKAIGCARIRADINGTKMPNTVGYDIFDFYLTQYGVIPRGHEDTTVNVDDKSGWGRGITILTTGKIDY